MKIRIIKCSVIENMKPMTYWYRDILGSVHDVIKENDKFYIIDNGYRSAEVLKTDCEIVNCVVVEGELEIKQTENHDYVITLSNKPLEDLMGKFNGKRIRILIEEIE